MSSVQFNISPKADLIQRLRSSDGISDKNLMFAYEMRCYDVWKKESVDFSAKEPIFFNLQKAIHRATQYYFIGNEEPRLLRFIPKSTKDKKSIPEERIILYADSPTAKRNRPFATNSMATAVVASSMAQPNLNLATFSILPYFNVNLLLNLPKVDSKNDNYWVDYNRKDFYWVKPDHELLLPNSGMPFETSPFQFIIKNIGVSADGSPALEADVVITFRRFLNKNWIAPLGKKKTRLISILKPSYRIRLPYIDGTGKQKHAYLDASTVTVKKAHIKLSFSVSNDWVRLLYSALSTPSLPATSRPTLVFGYYFNAMLRKRATVSYVANGLQLADSIQLNRLNRNSVVKELPASHLKSSAQKPVRALAKPGLPLTTNTAILIAHSPTVTAVSNVHWDNAAIDRLKKEEYLRQSIQLTQNVDFKLDCTAYGDYFTEFKNNAHVAIGCSEPMRLGQIKTPLYLKIQELEHAKYDVYKSQVMPQLFVIVPKQFIIARRLEDPEKFAPELFLHGAVDIENLADSRCVVNLRLQPDITYYERNRLADDLKNFTAYPAQITYINELVGEETINWNLSNSIIEKANTFTFEHAINATFETSIMDAQLCKSMLEGGGITGTYRKRLDTGLEVTAQLTVSLNTIAQPWSGEGLDIEVGNASLRITNQLEGNAYVERLVKFGAANEVEVPIQQNIVSGGTITVEGAFENGDYLPVFSVETDQQALSENYTYIEDLFQQIICFDLFSSPENGDLLGVHVGIQDRPPYTKLDFSGGSNEQESTLLIPISEIISSVHFGYFIKYRGANGTVYESNWIHHNFSSIGNIINITRNKIT
jgi:hypothetical protein